MSLERGEGEEALEKGIVGHRGHEGKNGKEGEGALPGERDRR